MFHHVAHGQVFFGGSYHVQLHRPLEHLLLALCHDQHGFIRPLTVAIAQLKDSEHGNQWQLVMAGNVILVLPILVVYVFLHKKIISGFVYSGIK